MKNQQIDKDFYQEEEDFIKDFNFDFYSSEEESETVTIQKKLRQIRKRKNKFLFLIFSYIAKNTDFNREFTREDIIKYFVDEEFKYNFQQLKEQIIKAKEFSKLSKLSGDVLDPLEIIGKNKEDIKDIDIVNYLYHYIGKKFNILLGSI